MAMFIFLYEAFLGATTIKWRSGSPTQSLIFSGYHYLQFSASTDPLEHPSFCPSKIAIILSSLYPIIAPPSPLCSHTLIPLPHPFITLPIRIIYDKYLQTCNLMTWSMFVKCFFDYRLKHNLYINLKTWAWQWDRKKNCFFLLFVKNLLCNNRMGFLRGRTLELLYKVPSLRASIGLFVMNPYDKKQDNFY